MQARPICENRLADFASVAHIDSTDDKYIQLSGNLHMHIYTYVCVYLFIHIYIHVHMYVYIYIFTHTHTYIYIYVIPSPLSLYYVNLFNSTNICYIDFYQNGLFHSPHQTILFSPQPS